MDSGNNSGKDGFWGSGQETVALSEGQTFLPCHFYEVHYLVALFSTTDLKLNPLLQGTGLRAGLRWKGRPVVALGLIQYRKSDLGAYNEIILSIPSIPAEEKLSLGGWGGLFGSLDKRSLGQYILQIPVTSQLSMIAGKELWGYPKRMEHIRHQFSREYMQSEMLDHENRMVLHCSGRLGVSVPTVPLSLVTYSFLHGRRLRTPVQVRGGMRWFPFQGIRLSIGASEDPLAGQLRQLGLDGKSPFLVMDSPSFQSIFYPGKEVGKDWR